MLQSNISQGCSHLKAWLNWKICFQAHSVAIGRKHECLMWGCSWCKSSLFLDQKMEKEDNILQTKATVSFITDLGSDINHICCILLVTQVNLGTGRGLNIRRCGVQWEPYSGFVSTSMCFTNVAKRQTQICIPLRFLSLRLFLCQTINSGSEFFFIFLTTLLIRA